MKPSLKVIEGGNPYLIESLEMLSESIKQGEIRAMAIVTLQGDDVHVDWVKSDGTTVTELIGAVQVLNQMLVNSVMGPAV